MRILASFLAVFLVAAGEPPAGKTVRLLTIGNRRAVGRVFGVRFSGLPAWFLWRGIYLSKMPTLARKVQIAFDWLWQMFFPRDIVELNLWQTERRYAALFTAWATLRRAQSEHQAVMLDAWTRAAGTFAQEANARAERGESFASAREMMSRWIETANAVLLEVQRSDKFLASQRAVLRASTDLRLAQQDVAAFLSEFYGQPTRAELDDVHQSLTELRREVRALRRERRQAGKAAKAGGSQVGEDAHG